MVTQVTDGIKISVRTRFRKEYTDPFRENFLFSYSIRIENTSSTTVKLLRRHWHIYDSCGENREVEGEGVVGLQPVLQSGEVHEYESACNLTSAMGKMHGTYLMEQTDTGRQFNVDIPSFEMYVPFLLN